MLTYLNDFITFLNKCIALLTGNIWSLEFGSCEKKMFLTTLPPAVGCSLIYIFKSTHTVQ